MSVIPGKRQSKKDRLLEIIDDGKSRSGYIIFRCSSVVNPHKYHYIIKEARKIKRLRAYIRHTYTEELEHAGYHKYTCIRSALYVNGEYDLKDILEGLDLNEEYIYNS